VGLESRYSVLESEVAPVIERIVVQARLEKLPRLTEAERNIWDNFVYHQQKRAPDAFHRIGLVSNFEKDLQRFVEEFEREHRPLTEQERADMLSA
jgi:hypothetical protein